MREGSRGPPMAPSRHARPIEGTSVSGLIRGDFLPPGANCWYESGRIGCLICGSRYVDRNMGKERIATSGKALDWLGIERRRGGFPHPAL
jgi:hypothetical protein